MEENSCCYVPGNRQFSSCSYLCKQRHTQTHKSAIFLFFFPPVISFFYLLFLLFQYLVTFFHFFPPQTHTHTHTHTKLLESLIAKTTRTTAASAAKHTKHTLFFKNFFPFFFPKQTNKHQQTQTRCFAVFTRRNFRIDTCFIGTFFKVC